MNQKFNHSIIEHVVFDIDGTWYDKKEEHIPGNGSIQTAHDFFRFQAWDLIKNKGMEPYQAAKFLVEDYHTKLKEGTNLNMTVAQIPEEVKTDLLNAIKEYGSNGKSFDKGFNLNNSKFLHQQMLQHIVFKSVLKDDPEIKNTFNYLKETGYNLGALTTETIKTSQDVADAMGFDLNMFSMNTGDKYPILCSENVKEKKPSPEGFERLIEIYKVDNPKKIVYVGDSIKKDIEAPMKVGLQAIHVINSGNDINFKNLNINGVDKQYAEIGNINDLERLL